MARFSRISNSNRVDVSEPPMNLTSLIDVVFVVLIMFIVIAPLLEIDRISLAEASAQRSGHVSSSVQESSLIAIAVDGGNDLSFNKRKVSLPQLKMLLKHAHGKHPSIRPQLFHDKNAPFGTYQSIKNAVEEAGFKELDVVLMPGE